MITICLCFLGMTMTATTVTDVTDFLKTLPADVNGWKKAAGHTVYNRDNLYKYINGGAELYISYNFKRVLAQKYQKGEGLEINVDIFDMGSSFNAFGVFAHSSEVPDKGDNRIGQGSEYAAGLLTFWKDKYYVSVLAYPENEEKRKTVLTIGRDIAGAIAADGPLPPIISLLPPDNLIKERILYFNHHNWLNSRYFISGENILHIDRETHAVLAEYAEKEETFFVLLVTYPDKTKAQAAYKNFLKIYLPDATKGVRQLEDGRWTGCKSEGNLITAVLDSPSREIVDNFLL
ncbi:MAG: hypothetical protein GY950_32785 [bacterium]|nr:hypothetical protein [bacterium]